MLGVASASSLGFTFLSIGDWGQPEGASKVAPLMATYQPDFVLALGDNFYDKGVESVEDPQFETTFERIFEQPSLQVPWYVCGGNHDYYASNQVSAQIAYSKVSPGGRWHYPSLYFAETHVAVDGTRFLVVSLDTWLLNGGDTGHNLLPATPATASGGDPEQLTWLERTLDSSDADWKVVIGHFPVFSSSTAHGGTPRLQQQLLPVLKRGGADLYLSGHDHILQHIERDGIHFLGSGAGAMVDAGSADPGYAGLRGYADRGYGFMVHEGSRDHLTTTFRTATDAPGGGAPYSFTVRRSDRSSRKGPPALPTRRRRRGEGKRRGRRGMEASHASVQEQQGQLEAPTSTVPTGMLAPWLAPWLVPWGGVQQQASEAASLPSSRRTRSEF